MPAVMCRGVVMSPFDQRLCESLQRVELIAGQLIEANVLVQNPHRVLDLARDEKALAVTPRP
jgi:hypothetical protein